MSTTGRHIATALLIGALSVLLNAGPATTDAQPAAATSRVVKPVQVTVVDSTNGRWAGLSRVVAGWNQSPYVHLTVRAACAPATFCAVVSAGYYGRTRWGAQTYPPSPMQHSRVQLNLYTLPRSFPTPDKQAAVLCHELGHVLGIAHPKDHADPNTRGCIASTVPSNVTPTPSAADLLALAVARNGGRGDGWGAVQQ